MQLALDSLMSEFRGAWRFRRYALATAWGVCLFGWLAVYTIPNRYEAYARVNVDTKTALRPLLEGIAVNPDVETQLNLMKQSLLGRANLDKVATQLGLDTKVVTPADRDSLITGLSTRINISLEAPTVRDARIPNTLYRITFQDPERQTALKVVDLLLNAFVEDTMGASGTGSAQRFLREQIADYDRRLADAEARLAEFKKHNFGLVPGAAQGDHFSRLTTETQEVQRLNSQLDVANSRRAELMRQLRGETPYVAPSAGTGVPRPANGQGAQDTAGRIAETQARLDDMLLRFTDKHPDVVATRETLQQLRKRQEEEVAALRRGDMSAAALAGAATNPVYQNIQLQLNQVDVQLAELRVQLADHRRNEAELRRLVDTAPEVEAEYARLTRDYDVTKTQYNALLERLERARVSGDAEQTGVVRFNVVDPPTAGFKPAFPNRPLLLAGVLFAGLLVGAGVAYLLHMLRPVFSSERALAERTGLPVLGVVTRSWVDKYREQMRAGMLRYSIAAGLLIVVFVVVVAVQDNGSRLLRQFI
jgi:polysaccharide chain length determinant protein (PEP-CTERM system associated)